MKKIILLFTLAVVVLSSLAAKAEISADRFAADVTSALTENGYAPTDLQIEATLSGQLYGQISDMVANDENIFRNITFSSGNFKFACVATVRVYRTLDRQVFIHQCQVKTAYKQLIPPTLIK